ncbi:MAG: histidine--tRNA ligase [Anaerolineae bacterium]|nr:histidine--tRNA ligase [Anaerolineae bacterium]
MRQNMDKFTRPTGTQDLLPAEQPYWEYVSSSAAATARRFGYERIETPIFESTGLFARGVGGSTDIVEKEMYSFRDKGDHALTLRPEFTAGVVRAYIENGLHTLPKPVKLFSLGPIFRYERPQAGRFRQFHQFNAEIFGIQDPLADLESMLLAWDLYAGWDFKGLAFQLNSTGCPTCRPTFSAALRDYYQGHLHEICDDCKRRLETNPLRVLDCKQERCQPVIAGAPQSTEHLCEDCSTHFASLRSYLDALGRPYTINPRLVRGLDYYTKTVFEVWAEGIGAQAAVCGGGRYDGLIELLGGRPTPAVGFAAGLERIILVMKAQGLTPPTLPLPPVFIAFPSDAARATAVRLLVDLRAAAIGAQIAMGGSLKAQLRQADKAQARFVFIIGEDELARGEVNLKDMATGEQLTIALEAATAQVARALSAR